MVEDLEQFGRLRKKTWRHGKGVEKRDNGVFVVKSHGIFLQITFTNFVLELFHIEKDWKYIFWGSFENIFRKVEILYLIFEV
jgi:hypothetical protein